MIFYSEYTKHLTVHLLIITIILGLNSCSDNKKRYSERFDDIKEMIKTDKEGSINKIDSLLSESDISQYPSIKKRLTICKARLLINQNKVEKSKNLLENLLKMGDLDIINKINTYRILGSCYYHKNDYDKAIEYFKRCKALLKMKQDSKNILTTLSNISLVFNRLDKKFLYKKTCQEAFKYIDGVEEDAAVNFLYNLSYHYIRNNEPEQAFETIQKALTYKSKEFDPTKNGLYYLNLGATYLLLDSINKAKPLLTTALEIFNKKKDTTLQHTIEIYMAKTILRQGDKKEALRRVEQAYKNIVDKEYKFILKKIYIEILLANGVYDKAYRTIQNHFKKNLNRLQHYELLTFYYKTTGDLKNLYTFDRLLNQETIKNEKENIRSIQNEFKEFIKYRSIETREKKEIQRAESLEYNLNRQEIIISLEYIIISLIIISILYIYILMKKYRKEHKIVSNIKIKNETSFQFYESLSNKNISNMTVLSTALYKNRNNISTKTENDIKSELSTLSLDILTTFTKNTLSQDKNTK